MKNKIDYITIVRVVFALIIVLIIVYGLFHYLPTLLALFTVCLLGLIAIDIFEEEI